MGGGREGRGEGGRGGGKEGGEGEGGRDGEWEGEYSHTVINADFLKTGNILLQLTELWEPG